MYCTLIIHTMYNVLHHPLELPANPKLNQIKRPRLFLAPTGESELSNDIFWNSHFVTSRSLLRSKDIWGWILRFWDFDLKNFEIKSSLYRVIKQCLRSKFKKFTLERLLTSTTLKGQSENFYKISGDNSVSPIFLGSARNSRWWWPVTGSDLNWIPIHIFWSIWC